MLSTFALHSGRTNEEKYADLLKEMPIETGDLGLHKTFTLLTLTTTLFMKKLALSLSLFFLACMTATAKSVVFTLSNGTKIYYLLGGETNPVMRFVDGKITVNADSYEFADIKNFYISATDDPTAIEAVLDKRNISFKDNTVVIQSSKTSTAAVYAIGGTAVKADMQKDGDILTIDLSSLPAGSYVIKAGKASFKVTKR